jgi:hypothetical protein
MRTRFLVAFLGIVALGVAAVLAISLASPPVASPVRVADPAFRAIETAPVRGPVAVQPPAAPAPVAESAPPPVPPGPAPLSAPVRAAPVAAPEYADQLQSNDADERSAAMLEMRQRRQTQSMDWLNRRARK